MTLIDTFKVRLIVCMAALLLACMAAEAQVGPGATGKIAKFKTPTSVGDSVISEDKFGMTGGLRFPDGTVQTPALKDPALSAFQTELTIIIPAGTHNGLAAFQVPSKRRLVIENLTLKASTGNNGSFSTCQLFTEVNGVIVKHQIIPTLIKSGASEDLFGFQNQVRLYADGSPASAVFLDVFRSDTQVVGVVQLTISGYLVELSLPQEKQMMGEKLSSLKTAIRD